MTGHGPMRAQDTPIPPLPRLEDALAVVAQSLASVPPEKRQVLLGVLATYSSNPAAEGNALDYLQAELKKAALDAGNPSRVSVKQVQHIDPATIPTGHSPGGKT